MRTLLLSENFPPRTGGSGRWFWETYRRLPREEFVIAAGQTEGASAFDETHNLRIHRLPLSLKAWGVRSVSGLRAYWRTNQALKRIVRSDDVSIIHCGRCLPEGLMALVLKMTRRVPYLCYVHGEDVSTARESREHTWLVHRVLRGASLLIANSANTGRILREEWQTPEEKVQVLYPGVDTRLFSPAPRDPNYRERLGWGNRPVILTVGRLQKRKGQDMMIRALVTIRRSLPDILYSIIGDGEERASLGALAESMGLSNQVQFLGELGDNELLRCYQQCDLFALPNRQEGKDFEGFGMVLLEAQACGKPVLAGDSGGTAETMRVPETGCVVNCDGPDQLASVVSELLAHPDRLEQMGRNGRQWVVDRFDWAALTRQAQELFRAMQPELTAAGALA